MDDFANWLNSQSDVMVVVWFCVALGVIVLIIGLIIGLVRGQISRWRTRK